MRGKLLRGCSVFCGLLLLWQLASYSGIPTFLLPSPAAVAEALWNNRSYLASHTLVTLSEILSGMALGVALGMVLALCMTMSPRLQRWVMPLVLTSQAIPVFALAPLLVLWFGFGMSAKVMMAVLVIFFPVTSAFFDGLQRVNRDYLDLARTIKKFLDALQQGVSYLRAHPQQTWQRFAKAHPELNTELNQQAWLQSVPLFATDPAALDKPRYDAYEQILYNNKLVKKVTPLANYAIELR